MAIVNATIKQQVSALIDQTKVLEQEQSQEAFAQGIANIIEAALKSAQVVLPPSSIVTVGSATTQTNAAPAIGSLQ